MTLRDRIESNFIPEPNSGCWIWLGNIQKSGHGRMKVRGATTPVHRAAWEAFRFPVPPGLSVCHSCDVPGCVNPDHLFLGTSADNHADRNRKGRQARGERSGRAKLTAAQVMEIRNDLRSGLKIAAAYGMGSSQVYRIKNGENWSHLVAPRER